MCSSCSLFNQNKGLNKLLESATKVTTRMDVQGCPQVMLTCFEYASLVMHVIKLYAVFKADLLDSCSSVDPVRP